jgi:hypothetical protein
MPPEAAAALQHRSPTAGLIHPTPHQPDIAAPVPNNHTEGGTSTQGLHPAAVQ